MTSFRVTKNLRRKVQAVLDACEPYDERKIVSGWYSASAIVGSELGEDQAMCLNNDERDPIEIAVTLMEHQERTGRDSQELLAGLAAVEIRWEHDEWGDEVWHHFLHFKEAA
jgi:hypothetical protein